MGELPPERMREAVEAVAREICPVPWEKTVEMRWDDAYRHRAEGVIEVLLPFLSAPPSQLPAAEQEGLVEKWCEKHRGIYYGADHPDPDCRTCYAVDSRPSLDLTGGEE